METPTDTLYARYFELQAEHDAVVPVSVGRYAHALFLDLVKRFDAPLSAQLHDPQGRHPFTVFLPQGAHLHDGPICFKKQQVYYLRVTLLDGGAIWQKLSTYFLETNPLIVALGKATFRVLRILSHPGDDNSGHAGSACWGSLYHTDGFPSITLSFVSPTAFSMGERKFSLFPHPELIWGSLLRTWNTYAPPHFRFEKAILLPWIEQSIRFCEGELATTMHSFGSFVQKGFQGNCHFALPPEESFAPCVCALAAFAPYAGVGSKTTMGMGQVRVAFADDAVTCRSSLPFSVPRT